MDNTLPPNIVITGSFRSGTTLLMLLFPHAFRDVTIHNGEVSALQIQLSASYKWRVSKLPNDIHNVRVLYKRFDPYIIYMVRDPRDCIVSWKEKKNDYHLFYDEWQRNMLFAESSKSSKLIFIKFEKLILQPEEVETYLLERIEGLEKQRDLAKSYKYMDRKNPFVHQLTHDSGPNRSGDTIRPLAPSVIGSWKHDKPRIRNQLAKFPEMQAALEKYGYEEDDSWQKLLDE